MLYTCLCVMVDAAVMFIYLAYSQRESKVYSLPALTLWQDRPLLLLGKLCFC